MDAGSMVAEQGRRPVGLDCTNRLARGWRIPSAALRGLVAAPPSTRHRPSTYSTPHLGPAKSIHDSWDGGGWAGPTRPSAAQPTPDDHDSIGSGQENAHEPIHVRHFRYDRFSRSRGIG